MNVNQPKLLSRTDMEFELQVDAELCNQAADLVAAGHELEQLGVLVSPDGSRAVVLLSTVK